MHDREPDRAETIRQIAGILATAYLKGHSRVIALADYAVEKTLVLTVPHRVLLGDAETTSLAPHPGTAQRPVRKRRPRDCPF